MICAKFGWNWPSGSGEEDENVKNLQTDEQRTGDLKSLGEPKILEPNVKVSSRGRPLWNEYHISSTLCSKVISEVKVFKK